MWTVLKIDKGKTEFFKTEINKKLINKSNFYIPKYYIQKYYKNKLVKRELNLLGDYIFCYNNSFTDPKVIKNLKFTKGLKYILEGFKKSQNEIQNFIEKCKENENEEGYLAHNFLEIFKDKKYKFSSGPFSQIIFDVINLQRKKIDIFLGNLKITVNRDKYFITYI